MVNLGKGAEIIMEMKDLKEMGYESEEEFIAELLGCNEDYNLEDFLDSYDAD